MLWFYFKFILFFPWDVKLERINKLECKTTVILADSVCWSFSIYLASIIQLCRIYIYVYVDMYIYSIHSHMKECKFCGKMKWKDKFVWYNKLWTPYMRFFHNLNFLWISWIHSRSISEILLKCNNKYNTT